jgi:hypothetical protein
MLLVETFRRKGHVWTNFLQIFVKIVNFIHASMNEINFFRFNPEDTEG